MSKRPPIPTLDYCRQNPDRINIMQSGGSKREWIVFRGNEVVSLWATHGAAMDYAHWAASTPPTGRRRAAK